MGKQSKKKVPKTEGTKVCATVATYMMSPPDANNTPEVIEMVADKMIEYLLEMYYIDNPEND